MNQQLRELWNRSRYPSGRGHDEKRFAELIVQACADIADNRPSVLIDKTTGDLIKEHFGVES